MKPNEEYWLGLYNKGLMEVDFENGIVYSWMNNGCKKRDYKKKIGSKSTDGYIGLHCRKFFISAHRFIWIVANGEIPEKLEINHKNGIRDDNRLANLEVVTHSENNIHRIRVLKHITHKSGENCNLSKFTWDMIIEIRRLYEEEGKSAYYIAKLYGIDRSGVSDIVSYRSWKNEKDCTKQ